MSFLSVDNGLVNRYQVVLSADNGCLIKGRRALLIVFALGDGGRGLGSILYDRKTDFAAPFTFAALINRREQHLWHKIYT